MDENVDAEFHEKLALEKKKLDRERRIRKTYEALAPETETLEETCPYDKPPSVPGTKSPGIAASSPNAEGHEQTEEELPEEATTSNDIAQSTHENEDMQEIKKAQYQYTGLLNDQEKKLTLLVENMLCPYISNEKRQQLGKDLEVLQNELTETSNSLYDILETQLHMADTNNELDTAEAEGLVDRPARVRRMPRPSKTDKAPQGVCARRRAEKKGMVTEPYFRDLPATESDSEAGTCKKRRTAHHSDVDRTLVNEVSAEFVTVMTYGIGKI
ncbi:uncharacterized protein LOC129715805 isoform X2 [Leucoraja erinacea]|uniref:uncharacterized protein LOC129715805 isoform X2 n=1 Tax=Leucoraja erinaceus TaxID=7782 RepID=UPI002455C56F|nr:uncharacterized protein LOC129715805 isoform X2 [Leucoraja erinacea]